MSSSTLLQSFVTLVRTGFWDFLASSIYLDLRTNKPNRTNLVSYLAIQSRNIDNTTWYDPVSTGRSLQSSNTSKLKSLPGQVTFTRRSQESLHGKDLTDNCSNAWLLQQFGIDNSPRKIKATKLITFIDPECTG